MGGTVENAIHESTAKKILHKLNPVHHKDNHKDNGKGKANDDTAEVHQSPEVTEDVKPLVERTKHVHSHAEHPAVESYVGSGLHGGIKEFLNSMNDEEAVGVISNLVRVQAVVGTGAAVREGEDSFATLACRAFSVLTVTEQSLMVLGDEKAMAVVGKLVAAQAAVFARASLDPISRQAAREAAMEAVTGSYDAVARKLGEAPHITIIAGLVAFLFFVPLTLSLWRFALYGLA